MPILRFCEATDEGAIGVHTGAGRPTWGENCRLNGPEAHGPQVCWIKKTQVGKCLFESERNGYHDSDFYMTYWDEETQFPKTVEFASTRGWCYPLMGSSPDATPDVIAKYEAWKVQARADALAADRKKKAQARREFRAKIRATARENGVSYPRLLKLRRNSHFDGMLALFGKRIRNGFRLKMRAQLVAWLNGESQYESPFSRKQMEYI